MAKIFFSKDITQDSLIAGLEANKVSLATFNSTVNTINNTITSNKNELQGNIDTVESNLTTAIQNLKDNEITDLTNAVNLLNADDNTEGSVDYKIKGAVTALINGAGDAYDTLKEIIDYVKNEDINLNDFITNVNNKVTALIDNASDNFNTLGKIETRIGEVNTRIDNLDSQSSDAIAEAVSKIPVHMLDWDLTIDSDKKVVLNKIPYGAIYGGVIKVYHNDADGNIVFDDIYTFTVDSNDSTGKTLVIDTDDTFNDDQKAVVEYDWRQFDNQ